MHMHRKVWEYCYIAQALQERGMLAPGRRGIGFAVGQEPLTALFASLGCEIVATDLATSEAVSAGWVGTAQHADSLDALNQRGICPSDLFHERVSFRFLDMRSLPDDQWGYDFIWSACALEHLGTLELGEELIYKSLKYLKPGGVAVHTTEFNVSSNAGTVCAGPDVIYRRKDLERILSHLQELGYSVESDFTLGNLPADQVVDQPPFKHQIHLRLSLGGYVSTSFGLIIENAWSRF